MAEGHRDTATLLTSGRISVSDALPLPQQPANLETVEVLPAPLSLHSEKPKGPPGELPWWAQAETAVRRLDAWSTQDKLKRAEDDLFVYRGAAGDEWTVFRPARRVRLRNGRPDPKQADASLFATEQIVEDTHFLAELQGSREDMQQLANKLAPILEGSRWLRVGRGGAPVAVVDLAWPSAPSVAETPERALLILTSDLLVRDKYLRWCAALDEAVLRGLLGVDVQLGKSTQESVMVRGFNGTSRLWRMPAAGIRRGSVFEASGQAVGELAARAVRGQWLGERTHEGFGRFRLDAVLPGVTGEAITTDEPKGAVDAEEEAIANCTKKWFQEHEALAKAGSERKPSLSQWFGLVADLERNDANAIGSRLNPTTAGAKSWKHSDAAAVLKKLQALPPEQRAPHARFFVRWLRAAMRANRTEEST